MFSTLKINNWRSHKESTVTFSKGVNVILGDMGSGKSSLIDALCFALYGTFPALKSKASSLEDILNKNINAKNFLVELTFTVGTNTLKIQRTFDGKTSKASLWVNEKFVEGTQPSRTNEALFSYLKVSYDDFISINYSSQGSIDYFINLTPKERRLELDAFLGLNKLNDLNEQSKIFRNKFGVIKKTISSSNPLVRLKEFETKVSEISKSVSNLEAELTQNELLFKKYSLEVKNTQEKVLEVVKKFKEKEEKRKEFEEIEKKTVFLKGKISDLKKVDLNLLKKLEENYIQMKKTSDSQEKQLIEYEKALSDYSLKLKMLNDYSKKYSEITAKKVQIIITEVKIELDSLKTKKASFDAEQIDLKEKIQVLLKETNGICYACERLLSKEEKNLLESKLNNKITELNVNLQILNQKLSTLNIQAKENEDKQNELLKLEEMHKFYSEKISSLNNLKEPTKPIFIESIKEKTMKLFEEITILKKDLAFNEQASKNKVEFELLNKQLSQLKEYLDKLLITQEDVDSLRKEYYEREEKRKLCESKTNSIQALLKKSLEEKSFIDSQILVEKEKVEQITKLENTLLFLEDFSKKISLVQENYRKTALNHLNSLMNKVWKTLYPHQNYDSILLKPEDDSYGLYLQSGTISIPVETGSGGERICIALCLRTAFAILRKSGVSTLIFDEPTHNLDEKAVIQFSNTLKNNYSTLIPQTIIITHDENLKEAATGKTILISRLDKISKTEEL